MSFYVGSLALGLTAIQQQHAFSEQLGHSRGEGLALHSEGRQPQSAHLISILRQSRD